jgi:hypothetical protein
VRAVRFRSLAAVVLLMLVAVAGVAVVRELTRPVPEEQIPPINIEPKPGVQAGEPVEDDEGSRKQKRKRDREREGGFEPPSAATPEPDARGAPDTPPPQIEVPPAAPSGDADDDGGDD